MTEAVPLAVVLLRQGQAWQRGERLGLEELLARHPNLARDDDAVLDLIYNEVVLREQAGEAPSLGDYLPRFPHLAAGCSAGRSQLPPAGGPTRGGHRQGEWRRGSSRLSR